MLRNRLSHKIDRRLSFLWTVTFHHRIQFQTSRAGIAGLDCGEAYWEGLGGLNIKLSTMLLDHGVVGGGVPTMEWSFSAECHLSDATFHRLTTPILGSGLKESQHEVGMTSACNFLGDKVPTMVVDQNNTFLW